MPPELAVNSAEMEKGTLLIDLQQRVKHQRKNSRVQTLFRNTNGGTITLFVICSPPTVTT